MIGFQMAWWQFFTITYCLALTATAGASLFTHGCDLLYFGAFWPD